MIKQKKSEASDTQVKFSNNLLKAAKIEPESTDHMHWSEVAKLPLDVDHTDFIAALDGGPLPEPVVEFSTVDPKLSHFINMIEKSKPATSDGQRTSADRMTLEQFIEDYI